MLRHSTFKLAVITRSIRRPFATKELTEFHSDPRVFYLGRVPFTWSDEVISGKLAKVGKLLQADLLRTENGNSTRYAMIKYEKLDDSFKAIDIANNKGWNPLKVVSYKQVYKIKEEIKNKNVLIFQNLPINDKEILARMIAEVEIPLYVHINRTR